MGVADCEDAGRVGVADCEDAILVGVPDCDATGGRVEAAELVGTGVGDGEDAPGTASTSAPHNSVMLLIG